MSVFKSLCTRLIWLLSAFKYTLTHHQHYRRRRRRYMSRLYTIKASRDVADAYAGAAAAHPRLELAPGFSG